MNKPVAFTWSSLCLYCAVQPKFAHMFLSVANPREQPIESIREGQVVYLRLKV